MATLFKNALASEMEAMYYDSTTSGISPRELSRFIKRSDSESGCYKFLVVHNGESHLILECDLKQSMQYRRMYKFFEGCFGSPSAICNLLFLKQHGSLNKALSIYKEIQNAV